MADYVVRVEASTEEAEKKLKRVDERVVKLEKGASIDIRLPSAEQTLSTLQKIGTTTVEVAKQALAVSRAVNMGPGAVINDLSDLFNIVKTGAQGAISAIGTLKKSTPSNLLGSAFSVATDQAAKFTQSISNIGYEIFGLTQSVNTLKSAFGGLFDETIGREIRLQESLLRTRTTLASTADVAINGKRLTDPYQALIALEKPVESVIENIRRRSLDIAGTTSDAIIQVFGVVASQVGAFGGTLKDAEDLAVTFAGALGTIGMSDPMLATQEIRSILTGNIDQNSVLARSLGISNQEIQKAKTSAEGLVAYLERRLAAFTVGQKLAAQGFAGITSNIQEVREEAFRSLGKPILQPLLESLTAVYERLQLVFDQILGIGDGIGRIASIGFSGIMSGVQAAPVLQNFSSTAQIQVFKDAEQAIASFAVRAQKEIDKVRPVIARIANEAIIAVGLVADGLGKLAAGYAVFKFEQLKVLASSLTTIGQVLNSTLLPALNSILGLYGQLLSNPVFQYISQLTVTIQLLEKTGVNSALRLWYYWQFAFKESIKTAMSWLKTATDILRSFVNQAVNFITEGIKKIGATIAETGEIIIAKATQIITKIIVQVTRFVQFVGQKLIEIAALIQQTYPKLGELAVVIASVGKSFNNVDIAAKKAINSVSLYSRQAVAGLNAVQQAANKTAVAIKNVGNTIGSFLTANLGKGLKGLLSFAKGFIWFQIGIFALEKSLAVVTDLIMRWRRAVDDANDSVAVAQGLKRLSTSYSDIGKNASLATKALKEYEEAGLKQLRDKLDKKIVDGAKAYQEAQKKLSEANAYNKKLQDTPMYGNVKPTLISTEQYQKAIRDYEKYMEERDKIDKYFENQQAKIKEREDVSILAKERKDIEEAIKEYRKSIEKELADERFQSLQEVARIEQQIFEEKRRIEKADLDRRLARESDGLVGIQAEVARIWDDYERGLFDAQTEAQRKEFEALQARQSLEKSIADYKIKLEEQTLKLRQRMGEFNKKVVDYEVAQRERSARAVLEYAIKANRAAVSGYLPGPKDKEAFQNAASGRGYSAEDILTFLYAGGARELGAVPGSDPKAIVNSVLNNANFKRIFSSPKQRELLNDYARANLGQTQGGTFARQAARDDFNLNRWYNQKLPPPPKLQGFSDLERFNETLVEERRQIGEKVQSSLERLTAVINQNNLQQIYKDLYASLSKPSLYTDVVQPESSESSLAEARSEYELLKTTIAEGATEVPALTRELGKLNFVAGEVLRGSLKRSPIFKNYTDDQFESLIKGVRQSAILSKGTKPGKEVLDPMFRNLKDEGRELIVSIVRGIADAIDQIETSVPINERDKVIRYLTEDLAAFAKSIKEGLLDVQISGLEGLLDIAAGDSAFKRRLGKATIDNIQRTKTYQDKGALNTPEGIAQLEKENRQWIEVNKQIGRFEEALKNTISRMQLADDLAKTMSEGYKRIFTEGLRGGDIKTLFNDMLTGMQETLVGSFLDYAMRPAMEQMKNQFLKILQAPSAEEVAQQYRDTLLKDSNTYISTLNVKLDENTKALIANTTARSTGPSSILSSSSSPLNNESNTAVDNATKAATQSITKKAFDLDRELTQTTTTVAKVRSSTTPLPQQFSNLQRGIGGLVTMFSSIAMGIAGANQMSGGGTYNTLMGLAGIFGAIGSITGMASGLFKSSGAAASLGVKAQNVKFNPKSFSMPNLLGRASGGPVNAAQPYIVGEVGPELFIPSLSGQILPTDATQRYLRAGETAGLTEAEASYGMSARDRFASSNTNNARSDAYNSSSDIRYMRGAMTAATLPAPSYIRQSTENASSTSTTERLVEQMSSKPTKLEFAYETTIINNVEYVTADQFRKGLSDAAERGRALTLGSLKNSVKARRGIGL